MAKQSKSSSLVFIAVLAIGLAGSLVGVHLWGEKAKEKAPAQPVHPPEALEAVTGAYLQGGQPQRQGPGREFFGSALPDFVIALDAWGRGTGNASTIAADMQEARAALMGAARKAELSETVVERLSLLVDSALAAASEPDGAIDDIADDMMKQTLSLNDALASSGLGFFVDTDLLTYDKGRRSVLLFSFEVLRVVLYRSSGHDVRTLRVRRLDNLNWTYNLLGFTTPQRRDAVVLDNKIDEHLLELLPALSESFSMDPFHLKKQERYTPWFNDTRKLATSIIREELGSAGDGDLVTLGGLLARRSEIYADWSDKLESRGMSLKAPRTLEITWDYRMQMDGLVTQKAMDELDEIQDKLATPAMHTAFAMVREHFAQSVERHEAQHRLDLAALYTLPMPAELAEYVGELKEGYLGQGGLRSGSLAEASAYLSELARDPLTPKLNLTLLTGYLLSESKWGMSESYAALVILEGLAEELGIEHGPLVVGRRIDSATVAALYQQLAKVSSPELRDAAAKLWQRYFQTPLPTLELIAR